MPWNKDDDEAGKGPWGQSGGQSGGKGEKNDNQSPWGNGGKRPNNNWGSGGNRGPGNLPPDLDELLKRGKDTFKQAIPGGTGRGIWLLPLALLGALWVYKSVYQVQPDERGMVMNRVKPTKGGKLNSQPEVSLHSSVLKIKDDPSLVGGKAAARQEPPTGRSNEGSTSAADGVSSSPDGKTQFNTVKPEGQPAEKKSPLLELDSNHPVLAKLIHRLHGIGQSARMPYCRA